MPRPPPSAVKNSGGPNEISPGGSTDSIEPVPANALLVGPPRSGKTTALERTAASLREDGYSIDGLSCPEIREGGDRVGFEIVRVGGDERAVMAHVRFESGPRVGTYRVDVSAVDRLSAVALVDAVDRTDVDCLVIDEIAPMQLESERFVEATRSALDSSVPVVAAIKAGPTDGVLGAVKRRSDVDRFAVDTETRDDLPERLCEWIRTR
ncbi:nucleoside-triphosphatase [Natrialba swarupiae]|uniref:nucleoside-triphosphatase n=1 Tax=Natrialba swarupiae TaxID=2448032 RepID=UPI003083B675